MPKPVAYLRSRGPGAQQAATQAGSSQAILDDSIGAAVAAGGDEVKLMSIDPGTTESAYCLMRNGNVEAFGKVPNYDILRMFNTGLCLTDAVCERIRSYGMPVGAEVLETCEWCGRFQQEALRQGIAWHWLTRKDVTSHLCGQSKAGDANVRCALIDRFCGKELAIGRKKSPGPLYKMAGDSWSALGVGVTWMDMHKTESVEGAK